jgi:uncharacterized DUF497 family protein
MILYWDAEKSQLLKETRGIEFASIEAMIQAGCPYKLMDHHNKDIYSHQKVIHIQKDDQIIEIPCVPHLDGYFCKTLYPSRKATKELRNIP